MRDVSVGGSINIQVLVDRLLLDRTAARRRAWSTLGQFRMPKSFSVPALGEFISRGLVSTFKNGPPVEFTSLIDTSDIRGSPCYRLASQHLPLTDRINNTVAEMGRVMIDDGLDPEAAQARFIAEKNRDVEGYSITGSLHLDRRVNCVRLRCDPRSKSVSIHSFAPRSTRPQDYPDKVSTTSELLEYIAAIYSSYLILDIGDPLWPEGYAWIKFITHLVDKRSVDLGSIRIDDHDPESWDFVNPEFDYESSGKA